VTAPDRRPPAGTRPALEGLCAALLDLPPHEARVLANEVAAMSRRLPSHARLALSAGYATTDALSLLHTGSRLHRLDAAQREALVDRLCAGTGTADLVDARYAALGVIGSDGSRADVRVHIHFPPWSLQGTRYISTNPDNTRADNLLFLPEC